MSRGVRLGWNRGRQTGDGRFRRWGLGYPGRRGSGFGPPGIHGARRHPQNCQGLAHFGVRGRHPFGFLPEPAGLVLAAKTAIEEPQVVADRDIAGITVQGLAKARLRLLPAALLVIREA